MEEIKDLGEGYKLYLRMPEGMTTSGTNLRQGDIVSISREAFNPETTVARGVIHAILEEEIHILLNELSEIFTKGVDGGNTYCIDAQPIEIVESREKIGLDWCIRGSFYSHLGEIKEFRDVILFHNSPRRRSSLPSNVLEEIESGPFDTSQRKAIRGALQAKEIYCIQGPPGTGKTTVICEIVRLIVKDFRATEAIQGNSQNIEGSYAMGVTFLLTILTSVLNFAITASPLLCPRSLIAQWTILFQN